MQNHLLTVQSCHDLLVARAAQVAM